MTFEYQSRDFHHWNLALLAKSSSLGDEIAAREFVRAVNTFATTNPAAFEAPKPFDFRNSAAIKQIEILANTPDLTEQQGKYLSIMKEGLQLQDDVLLLTGEAVVIPDTHHWNVELRNPDALPTSDNQYEFKGAAGRPAIMAYPALQWAGFLSNPADPTKSDFDPSFVHNETRLSTQASIIAEETGISKKTLLEAAFANAAQRIGLTLNFAPRPGQFGPDYWVDLSETTKRALGNPAP